MRSTSPHVGLAVLAAALGAASCTDGPARYGDGSGAILAVCRGLTSADFVSSPFRNPRLIERSETLYDAPGTKPTILTTRGVRLDVRPGRGESPQLLGRVIECDQAHARVGDPRVPLGSCPFAADGVSATVREARTSFVVELRSADVSTARALARGCQTPSSTTASR